MGFKKLLDFSVDGIPRHFSHFVLDKFSPRDMCLILDSGRVSINAEKIRSIFGIPSGGRELKMQGGENTSDSAFSEWVKQHGSKSVKSNALKNRITSTGKADRSFEYDFIMLFVNCLIECGKDRECKADVLKLFCKTDDVKELDWCSYVVNKIRCCKECWGNATPKSIFSGPLPILMMIYLDGTKCNNEKLSRVDLPIKHWTFQRIREREKYEIDGPVDVIDDDTYKMDVDDVAPKIHEEPANDACQASSSRHSAKVYEEQLTKMYVDLVIKRNEFDGLLSEALGHYPEAPFWHTFSDIFPPKEGDDDQANTAPESETGQEQEHAVTPPHGAAVEDSNESENFTKSDKAFWSDPEVLMLADELTSAYKASGHVSSVIDNSKLRGLQREQPANQIAGQTSHNTAAYFDDMPSFSLGVSQEHDIQRPTFQPGLKTHFMQPEDDSLDHIPVSERRKLVQSANVRNQPKRATTKTYVLRSPYLNRVVDIRVPTTRDEDKIWDLLFYPGLSDMECMFFHKNGAKVDRSQMQTLQPRGWVDEAVIDCWSLLLNHEELSRNPNSIHRFFCPVSAVTTNMLLNQTLTPLDKAVMFQHNIMPFINIAGTVKPVHTYDMVVLPICEGYHYFLLCFELKNPAVFIVDNMGGGLREPVIIEIYKQIVASFLEISGYDKAADIASSQPVRLQLRWASDLNMDDSCIYMMRHMETYKGRYGGNFNPGFAAEGSGLVNQILKLRCKYASKLLLSRLNKFRPRIVEQASKISKVGGRAKKNASDPVDLFDD